MVVKGIVVCNPAFPKALAVAQVEKKLHFATGTDHLCANSGSGT